MHIQSQEPKTIQKQQNYEDDYEQDGQDNQLKVYIQQKQPQQKFVSLLTQPENNSNQNSDSKQQVQQKTLLIGKLKNILHSKLEQIKQVKKNVNNCRKQIKEIGDEVDKQMNKSIAKHSKPHNNINLQQIFQTSKTIDPHISQLNVQLSKIRAESKKLKGEIKTIQNQVNGPVNMINFQRAKEFKLKIRQIDTEIKQIRQQKQFLQLQLKMMENNEISSQNDGNIQIQQNRSKNSQILIQLKQQKSKIYQLQKLDRTLTEKIRYIQQLDQQVQIRKTRATIGAIIPKQQIEQTMKQIIQQIKQILEKRNKIENQRRNTLKNLENQVAGFQAKNWEIINKLRQIDAKLLKHYNSRIKKPKAHKQINQFNISEDTQNKKQRNIQTFNKSTKTAYGITVKNDKNILSQDLQNQTIVMVEKKKTYEFFMTQSENQPLGNIILSDQMLGNKLSLKKLNFTFDQNTLYGVNADYQNESKNQINGYKISSRIKPKQLITKTLTMDSSKGEVINLVHVGVDKNQNIKYLQIVTSEAKQFKWGALQDCQKNQQKNLRKYESLLLKGKLNQISEKQAPNYYCLAGIGFSVIYLAPK